MKPTVLLIAFFVAANAQSNAQSDSFRALENKFRFEDEVYAFKTSGVLARAVLWMTGNHDFKRAIKQVKNIRLIAIPKSAFKEQSVSVRGFKKVVEGDSFEELAQFREGGDEVSIFHQDLKNSPANRYQILIDNPDDVIAVEIKGYIDVNLLRDQDHNQSAKL